VLESEVVICDCPVVVGRLSAGEGTDRGTKEAMVVGGALLGCSVEEISGVDIRGGFASGEGVRGIGGIGGTAGGVISRLVVGGGDLDETSVVVEAPRSVLGNATDFGGTDRTFFEATTNPRFDLIAVACVVGRGDDAAKSE